MGLVDRAREAAKRAGDAAQKGASGARDRAQEMGLKRRQNALAAELGHVVVRQHDGESGLEPEVARLVSEIRAVQAEVEALDDE